MNKVDYSAINISQMNMNIFECAFRNIEWNTFIPIVTLIISANENESMQIQYDSPI